MLKRELALRVLISQIGISEIGTSNRGPVVDEYQRADALPGEGYPWCMSLQQWCWNAGMVSCSRRWFQLVLERGDRRRAPGRRHRRVRTVP